MSFADKLRKVVAANFVEISRPDTSDAKEAPKSAEPSPETPTPPAVIVEPIVAEAAALEALPALPVTEPESSVVLPDRENETAVPHGSDEGSIPEAVSVEPVVESVIPASADVEKRDPMTIVGPDGGVEFDQIFARGEVLAAASFTAEQALAMLHSMPSDLPLRVKRLTVKATLDAIGQAVGATPKHIVNDAEHKTATLEAFIREVSERSQELRNDADTEIERLRQLISEKEAEKAAISQREEAVFVSCRRKIDDLDQVVAFFTVGEVEEASSVDDSEQSEEDTDELPAYLQEDAVKRLLGIHGESDDAEAEPILADSDAVGARSRGSRARR